jgi:hypothetical protein
MKPLSNPDKQDSGFAKLFYANPQENMKNEKQSPSQNYRGVDLLRCHSLESVSYMLYDSPSSSRPAMSTSS